MECIKSGLKEVSMVADKLKASMACPRFGSEKAGGNWIDIETLIKEIMVANGTNVVVYDYTPPRKIRR
jgi:hypothetical protein